MQKYNKGVSYRDICLFLFGNTVAAEGFSFAFDRRPCQTLSIGGGIHQRRFVGEDSRLEVAVVVAFHTHAVALEVVATDIGHRAVENHYLEIYPRTKPPFQPAPQLRIFVEVLTVVLSWFFGMKQLHIDTPFQKLVEDLDERNHILAAADIAVFEVGGADP